MRHLLRTLAMLALSCLVALSGCGGGGGGGSTPPPQPPSAPTNLSITATSGAVGLTWTAVSGATGYNVYRGTVSGDLSAKTKVMYEITNAACIDSAVANGTVYYYQVTAINANGESIASSEVSAMPQDTLPPIAPTNLSATAASGSVGLTWTVAPGATGYNVYRATASGALSAKTKISSGVGSATYTDSAVTNGITYYYQVTAVNANGESDGSNEINAKPSALPAPTNLSAKAVSGSIQLTWNAVSGATSYNVYRGTASGALGTKTKIASGVGSAAYTDLAVTGGTTYYYQVTAVNPNGETGGSNEVNAKLPVPKVYPTGVNDNFQPLPGGSADPHYSLIISGQTTTQATVLSEANYWWEWPKPTDARWLYNADTIDSGFYGWVIFRTTFDLTGFDPSKTQISGKWSADQEGWIELNGVDTMISNLDYYNLTPFSITSGFKNGVNTLDFHVDLADGGDGLVISGVTLTTQP